MPKASERKDQARSHPRPLTTCAQQAPRTLAPSGFLCSDEPGLKPTSSPTQAASSRGSCGGHRCREQFLPTHGLKPPGRGCPQPDNQRTQQRGQWSPSPKGWAGSGAGFGARPRWDLVPQGRCHPDKTTHWEKMPGGPRARQTPHATIFLLLIFAAGMGTWSTGRCWGEVGGGTGRLLRGPRQWGRERSWQEGSSKDPVETASA